MTRDSHDTKDRVSPVGQVIDCSQLSLGLL